MPQDIHYDPLCFYFLYQSNDIYLQYGMDRPGHHYQLSPDEGSEVWVKDQEEETSEESKKRYVLGKLVDFSK